MVGVGAVGVHRPVVVDQLAVVPRPIGRVVEVEGGQGRGVRDVEGDLRPCALADHAPDRDARGRGVQREVVGDRVPRGGGAGGRGGDRQRVLPVGQAGPHLVLGVEHRRQVVGLGARDGPIRVAHRLVVLVVRVLPDGGPRLVRVRRGQGVHAAQQAGARLGAARRQGGGGAGDDVAPRIQDRLRVPRRQGVRPQGPARPRIDESGGVDVRGRDGGVARLRVEDIGGPPRPVEPQVGHRQVGAGPVLSGEPHETVDERALRGVRVGVGGEGGARGDGHRHGRPPGGGDGERRALPAPGHSRPRVRHRDALAAPVRAVQREEPAFYRLRQRLRGQGVGLRRIGQVVHGDGEGPARRAVTEVRLRPRGLGRAVHGRVHGGGRRRQGVHQARALLARRVERPGPLVGVHQRVRRPHDEALGDPHPLRRAHAGEKRIRAHPLEDDRGDARHLRSRHRRARCLVVGAAGDR